MTSENMNGADVLALQQIIYLNTADWKSRVVGKLSEIGEGLDFMGVDVDLDDAEYVNGPEKGQMLFGAAQGDNCVYRFNSVFHGSTALPDKRWYMDFPKQVQRQQLRQFVRVQVPQEMGLKVKLPNGFGSFKNAREMTICDISGNGICFASEHEAPVGSHVSIFIEDLPGYGSFKATATVRRCTQIRFLNHYIYHIGAHMENHISEKQQDKLVRALFQLQQQYLKKGVGV